MLYCAVILPITAQQVDDTYILNETMALAYSAYKAKEYAMCEDIYKKYLKISGDNALIYFNLGVVTAEQGKTKEALEYYKKSLELDSNSFNTNKNLGALIIGKQYSIIEEMNKNLDNPEKYDKLNIKLKEVYRKGLPYFKKAYELEYDKEVYTVLGGIYNVLGENNELDKLENSDRDFDGVLDKEDECPKIKGLANYKGCPDTDGDFIVDSEDECPKVKGIKRLKGCPDFENDVANGTWINYDNKSKLIVKKVFADRLDLTFKDGSTYSFYGSDEDGYKCDGYINNYSASISINNYVLELTLKGYKKDLFGSLMKNTIVNEYSKILTREIEERDKIFRDNNIFYRQTFNKGKIGTDYIPPIKSSYNAGKKYTINGHEIQEDDWRTYTKSGGYDQDIIGYTAIYQLINNSNNLYKITLATAGTSKMPNTVISNKWFSLAAYDVNNTYSSIYSEETFILKPNEKRKNQAIVGTEIPEDFAVVVKDIEIVSNEWVSGLQQAINGNDMNIIDKYYYDDKAKEWESKIKNNRDRVLSNNKEHFNSLYKSRITGSIQVENPSMFDKDFDSGVYVHLRNTSTKKMKVYFKTNFGEYSEIVEGNGYTKKRYEIKGYDANKLYVTITRVEEM